MGEGGRELGFCSVLRKVAVEIPSFIFITLAMEQSHSKRLSFLHILLTPHHKLQKIFTQYAFMRGERERLAIG